MITNDAARQIIIRHTEEIVENFEGLHLVAYRCPANVLTIGYGHTHGVYEGQKITQEEAEDLLADDLAQTESFLERILPSGLNGNQFSALCSLCFNIGPGNFASSALFKYLCGGNLVAAAAEFPKWRKGNGQVLPGLVKRRAQEKALFEELPS